jgi:hypothetical protein
MYTMAGISQMFLWLAVISFILAALLSNTKVSGLKVMLLGIALIVFSGSVLKGMVMYGLDEIVSIIGFSFCVVGFLKRDNLKL